MRVFLMLLAANIFASIASLLVMHISPSLLINHIGIFQVNMLGNAIFVAAFLLILIRVFSKANFELNWLLSAFAFLITTMLIAWCGFKLLDVYYPIGAFMLSQIATIGGFPAGPDVPFTEGIVIWAFTAILPIAAAFGLGGIFRIKS